MLEVIVVSLALLATGWLLWIDAPRHAQRLAGRTPTALLPTSEGSMIDLEHEICTRLRLAAVGSGVGVTLAAVPLLLRSIAGDAPDGLTAVATVLASAVVTAVATEATAVLRRMPRRTSGPRTAALTARAAHGGPAGSGAEIVLAALAVAAFALGVNLVARGAEGGAAAVGAGAGAVVVIGVCAVIRRAVLRHPLAATTTDGLAVHAAAGAVTTDRASENIVAGGGVLTLVALLGPTVLGSDGNQVVGLALGVVTLAVMAFLATIRRSQARA